MRGYKQLTLEQRYGIYSLLETGHTQSEMARVIGVHRSTISRELKRNKGVRGYRCPQAHRKALARRKGKVHIRIDTMIWELIDYLIREDWSPEQISGRLKLQMNFAVSHEWIYQHILEDKKQGGNLYIHLRCRKKRKKRYGSREYRGQIPNMKSIEARPAIVDRRERLGDWEVDTIIGKGKKQAIVSLVERKSRLSLIYKVVHKTKDQVTEAICKLLLPIKDDVHTLTSDHGKEFAGHEAIAEKLMAKFYFAHPYASYERGLNENMNGLIRQYFPKDRDFATIIPQEIISAMNKLNYRPRKCLGYKTPIEVFFGESHVALNT
jgi:IS30 family transposase